MNSYLIKKMKKTSFWAFLLLLLLGQTPWTASARNYNRAHLPLVVRVMPEWSNEYPTVINNWDGLFLNSFKGELPPLLSVVVSIDGKDTKGMNEETFNSLLLSQGQCTIEYLVKENGANLKRRCEMSYCPTIFWAEGIDVDEPGTFPENIGMKNIKNSSAFSFNTYGFSVSGEMDMDENGILEVAGKALDRLGYKKTEEAENADLLLQLQKGRDEYNGYAITLNILDGAKYLNKIERVVWSLQVSGLNGDQKTLERGVKKALNRFCSNFPFDIPTYSQSFTTLGIAFENEQAVPGGKTFKVLKGSDAYDKGLRSGDAVIGAYAGGDTNVIFTKTRRCYFKPNKKDKQKNWGVDLFLILPVIPQFTYNNAYHYLSDNTWRGGTGSNNHFKVRSTNGNKFTVNAPFDSKRFNLKFIP